MNERITKTKVVTFVTLRFLLLAIMIYNIVKLFINHNDEMDSRFFFVASQTLMLLIVSFLPSLIEKRWKIDIPDMMELLYIFLAIGALLLGEIGGLYEKTYWWDALIHGFSGGLIAIIGFSFINVLNKTKYTKLKLTPLFIAIFVFCFALSVGVIWEIIEFVIDYVTGSNMQRYFDDLNQVNFIGQRALADTMEDFIMNMAGALVVSLIGYFDCKKQINRMEKLTIELPSDEELQKLKEERKEKRENIKNKYKNILTNNNKEKETKTETKIETEIKEDKENK